MNSERLAGSLARPSASNQHGTRVRLAPSSATRNNETGESSSSVASSCVSSGSGARSMSGKATTMGAETL